MMVVLTDFTETLIMRLRLRVWAGPRRSFSQLQIADVRDEGKEIVVLLANHRPSTRVHLFSHFFFPQRTLADELQGQGAAPRPRTLPFSRASSVFMSQRHLSSEKQYCMDRAKAVKHPSVMLQRPALLLNRRHKQSTQMAAEPVLRGEGAMRPSKQAERESCADECDDEYVSAKDSEPMAGFSARRSDRKEGEHKKKMMRRSSPGGGSRGDALAGADYEHAQGFASLEFLGAPSARVFNLRCDDKGVVRVPRAALGAHHSFLAVVAVDDAGGHAHAQLVARGVALVPAAADKERAAEQHATAAAAAAAASFVVHPAFRECRLTTPLNAASHFTEQHLISELQTGQEKVVADIQTSQVEVFKSLGDVLGFFRAVNPSDPLLGKWGSELLLAWPALSAAEKLAKYAEFASHELNVFLWKKDPGFFAAVVRPHLAHKLRKTVVDLVMLGGEHAQEALRVYAAAPQRLAALNTFERILLASAAATASAATSSSDAATLARMLKDSLPPRQQEQFIRLFKTAMQGKALAAEESLAGAVKQQQQREVAMCTSSSSSSVADACAAASPPPPPPSGARMVRSLC